METPSYVISTNTGCIPNIIQPTHKSLKKNLLMYIDDFVFKESIYDEIELSNDKKISLRDLCSIPSDVKIYLTFKKGPKILSSKRGNYKLSKERYDILLDILNPDYYCCFRTGKMIDKLNKENIELVDPNDSKDFLYSLKQKKGLVGTRWINYVTENGCMLDFIGAKIIVNEIFECTCCNRLKEGYLKHLFNIKEMNCFYYLTIHNFNTVDKIFELIRKNEINTDELEIDDSILSMKTEEKKNYGASKKKEGKQREANRSKVVEKTSAKVSINP